MKPNWNISELLDAVSDLNMAAFYREEFKVWCTGKGTISENGEYIGVGKLAVKRGFTTPRAHNGPGQPQLSYKGKTLLDMTPKQNQGRWRMLMETLSDLAQKKEVK